MTQTISASVLSIKCIQSKAVYRFPSMSVTVVTKQTLFQGVEALKQLGK
jgi:hypothetical protein